MSVSSRTMGSLLKAGNQDAIARMSQRVHQQVEVGRFTRYFLPNTILVPVPGSAPSRPTETLTVTSLICRNLQSLGLGATVADLIQRVQSVPKSAFARPGNRPNVKVHYDSLRVERSISEFEDLLLIDDIVTRGCTLMGCALRLQEAYPNARILAFAMMRTMGLIPSIDSVLEPCQGSIVLQADGLTLREP